VHRLAALSSRSEELVAPAWTAKKMETYQYVLDRMREKNAFQGQYFVAKPAAAHEVVHA
jgi:radical SAM superfamily enzyme